MRNDVIAHCPECGQKNRLPDRLPAGYRLACGRCKTLFDEDDLNDDDEEDDDEADDE
jgi:RNA polymerase subunit RPABC4/transcription elongation factor Spt4